MSAEIILLPKTTLHEQVANRLRQMLVESQIQPGAKLNERELSEVLNVSRTPLREAIKMLAAEGLVELLPNRGAIAVELSEADIINTFEVMAGLEGQSGELAAQRITEVEVALTPRVPWRHTATVFDSYVDVLRFGLAVGAAALQPDRPIDVFQLSAVERRITPYYAGLRDVLHGADAMFAQVSPQTLARYTELAQRTRPRGFDHDVGAL